VAVKIKLKRMGKIRAPYYRIVVADARTKRDGRAIEEIGLYHPKADPSVIEVNSERVQHWLSVGAQPTDPVRHILKITGDWQKFRGEPGAEGTLRTAAPREDKKVRFAAAVKETLETSGATTPKGRARKTEQAPGHGDKPAEAGKSAKSGERGKAEPKADTDAKAKAKAGVGRPARQDQAGTSPEAAEQAEPAVAAAGSGAGEPGSGV
jgi:small subunit ribosomal protein S16